MNALARHPWRFSVPLIVIGVLLLPAGGVGVVVLLAAGCLIIAAYLQRRKLAEVQVRPDVVAATSASAGPRTRRPSLVQLAAAGPLLVPVGEDHEEQYEIAGEAYRSSAIARVFKARGQAIAGGTGAKRGTELHDLRCVLVPEPWNQYDENAVAVVVEDQHVGYLEAGVAEDYSPVLRAAQASGMGLVVGRARAWALDDSGTIRARITIWIPTIDYLDQMELPA